MLKVNVKSMVFILADKSQILGSKTFTALDLVIGNKLMLVNNLFSRVSIIMN